MQTVRLRSMLSPAALVHKLQTCVPHCHTLLLAHKAQGHAWPHSVDVAPASPAITL